MGYVGGEQKFCGRRRGFRVNMRGTSSLGINPQATSVTNLRPCQLAISTCFVFGGKFVARRFRTFATQSDKSGHQAAMALNWLVSRLADDQFTAMFSRSEASREAQSRQHGKSDHRR